MAQNKLGSFQIDVGTGVGQIPVLDGAGKLATGVVPTNITVDTATNSTQLNGQAASYYLNATNINAGTLNSARLSGTYGISISGNAATATNASQLGGTAAALYALLASPALTGNPTAPTQLSSDNSTKLATTAFVKSIVGSGGGIVASSLGTSGYVKFFNGYTIQWGTASVAYGAVTTIALPTSFTTTYIAVATSQLNAITLDSVNAWFPNTSQISFGRASNQVSTTTIQYIALGVI